MVHGGSGANSIPGVIVAVRVGIATVLVATIATDGVRRALPDSDTMVCLAEASLAGPADK